MGHAVVHVLGDGAHDLHGDLAGRLRRRRRLERLVGQLAPAQTEMVVDVGDDRPLEPGGDVMPAEPPLGLVRRGVVAVAGVVGEVDPADERDLAVDHDRLLVMAVERVLARIGLAADARVPRTRFSTVLATSLRVG